MIMELCILNTIVYSSSGTVEYHRNKGKALETIDVIKSPAVYWYQARTV